MMSDFRHSQFETKQAAVLAIWRNASIFVDMNRTRIQTFLTFIGLLAASLLFVQFALSAPKPGSADSKLFAEKVNLGLRRTAHYLLAELGDSTSRIPAVEQLKDGVWFVRMEQSFNYDRLPGFLQESFDLQGIHDDYNVAVLDCASGELQLGYNFGDFSQSQNATCGGREQVQKCYNLQVTFVDAAASSPNRSNMWWMLAGSFAIAGISIAFWRKPPQNAALATASDAPTTEGEEPLIFGNSQFNANNLVLLSSETTHQLTYREAKLLQLFVSHPNQLLARDFILKAVWEDEGIIVGRSLDVFVSRLRKMLRNDNLTQIVTVHGVGYRLEVGA